MLLVLLSIKNRELWSEEACCYRSNTMHFKYIAQYRSVNIYIIIKSRGIVEITYYTVKSLETLMMLVRCKKNRL